MIGHRGDPSRYPHNSIRGILAAADYASMAEIDVRQTGDGVPVLSHDPRHGSVVLFDNDWEDLVDLDIGRGHRLGQLLDLVERAGSFPLNIEIKNWPHEPDFDPTFAFPLAAAALARPFDLITCFHWPTMNAIKSGRPDLATGLVVDEGADVADAIKEATDHDHRALALHRSLIENEPEAVLAAAASLEIYVWTINDPELGTRLADAGVDGLITDHPATMVRALQGDDAMTIEQELDDELRDALRAKDRLRLDVIRQIRTGVTIAAAEPGGTHEETDALHRRIIRAYVKKMDKARREYEGYGARTADMVTKLRFETEYLSRWLPPPTSGGDVEHIVRTTITKLGVDDPKQAGRVIGAILKDHGDLDGGEVNRLVREALEG